MPDSPEHGCPVLLIERAVRVNEEKIPILLLFMFILKDVHRMDGVLYPRLQSSRKLCRASGRLGLRPGPPKRHFTIIRLHVSPTPTSLIPGCLSSAISRPLMSAR